MKAIMFCMLVVFLMAQTAVAVVTNETINAVSCTNCYDAGVIRTWRKCQSNRCKGRGTFVEYSTVKGKREINVVKCIYCNNTNNVVRKPGYIIDTEKPCPYCKAYAKLKPELLSRGVVVVGNMSRDSYVPTEPAVTVTITPFQNVVQPQTPENSDTKKGKCFSCSGRGYYYDTCSKCGGTGSIHVLTDREYGRNYDHRGRHKTRLSNCPICGGGGNGKIRGKEKKKCMSCDGTGRM